MAQLDSDKAEASAEKAYAEAAGEISPAKPGSKADAPEAVTASVEIPSVKPKDTVVPKVAAKPVSAKAEPVAAKAKASPAKRKPPVAKAKPVTAKPIPASKAMPVAKKAIPAATPKPVAKKAAPAATPKPFVAKAKPVKKPVSAKASLATTTAAVPASIPTVPTITAIAKSKDKTMNMKTKVTDGLNSMMTEAQTKAKEAFEKGSTMFGDYAEFTKGNVEAMIESGKILADGLQDMSTNLVAEGRLAFETASADMKEMAAAKSPTDLIQLQGDMFRKNFDSAVAYGSKNTEAMLKLASEVMAPLSSRMSLAVEKVRAATI